jgi:RNA polymerase sigma-70 factor (ECF subfamily)
MAANDSQPGVPAAPVFVTTHWSVVLTATGNDTTQAQAALEHLCRMYWYPIYHFVRRQGHSMHDAQDLTQEFFARLLEKNGSPVPTNHAAVFAPFS